MAQRVSASINRRSLVAGMALSAGPFVMLAVADNAYAAEKSLYDRLGGPEIQKPAIAEMAYEEPEPSAWAEVHADPMGL